MSRFMVTGGAGFIGGHIVELLVGEGHDVVVFDDFSTGSMDNLSAVAGRIEIVRGSILDKEAVGRAMAAVDHVIHQAAEISVIKSLEEPEFVNEVNVGGTLNILSAAREHRVRRVVLASSSAVYGDTGSIPQHENMLPNPISPYGASKIAAEHYLSCFYHLHGLETVRLRYFNVFGPRQNPRSQYAAVIPKFIDRILHGQTITINGDGQQTRDFVYVENVARANYLACTAEGVAGQVFNIAGGNSTSICDLTEKLLEITGRNVDVLHGPAITGDIKYSISETTRAREILGFEPKVSFEEGLKRTIDHLAAKAGAV